MQKKNPTLHLLLLDPSQNDAEQIVSLLRNAGHATRAHRVTSADDLEESLSNQTWDLFIAKETHDELTYDVCLSELKRLDKDIPFILLAESPDEEMMLAALKSGARDVLPKDSLTRLVLVTKREYAGLEDRRRRNKLESYLHEAEKRCQLLLESSRDAIAYVAEGMHIYANHSYLELFQYEDVDEMMCVPLMDIIASKDQDALKDILKTFKDKETETTLTCAVRKSDDSEIDVLLSFSGATYDGETCIQLIARPQVDSELEEKLKRFSSEDLLTGLYNKVYFADQLEIAREKALSGEQKGAAFYIELDDFADARAQYTINGSDALLAETATLLKSVCSKNEVVARLADNTFAVLAYNMEEKAAMDLGENIRKVIEDHVFTIGTKSAQLTASTGIVRINENAPPVKELLERCHKACSHVRSLPEHKKGNGFYLYNALDFEVGGRSEDLAAMLQQAMDDNRFKLLFQPVISLRGEGDEYYESFLRMVNNEGREISPNEFLPVEEMSELAVKLDRWVVLQNVKRLQSHRAKGHETHLFINLTRHTLIDKGFVEWLGIAMKASKLPGDALIFQVAEEGVVQHLRQAKEFFDGVSALGCKVSLSRFGCALNPFNTLKHINPHFVKLDGSFTDEVQRSEEARENLKEMVTELRAQKRKSIIPLVESAAILSTLWQAGVDYIQGYYLQAPTSEMNYDFSETD
jgi:diguanylate cyclase (GGDEF)-like protein